MDTIDITLQSLFWSTYGNLTKTKCLETVTGCFSQTAFMPDHGPSKETMTTKTFLLNYMNRNVMKDASLLDVAREGYSQSS